jgi:hypothetical protein
LASLAPAYTPRRPTETVLYGLVRDHLESFLAYAREHYDGGLPRYVEQELRAYLKCGVFSEGFTRCHCDACGHDLLVAFSCHGRSLCPSCAGRRMANTAAHLVDRVLPDVPVRQYVLTLPYELRRLAAFDARVLTSLSRIFVEAIVAHHRARAKDQGLDGAAGGSVTFVQRFGSLNLNVHFHVLVLDSVFTRSQETGVTFHPAPAPTAGDLEAIVRYVQRRSTTWLRRHGYLDERGPEDRSNETPTQTALDACAAIAIGRGTVASLPREGVGDETHGELPERPDKPVLAVERDGFNLHAGVRIEAGDDLGRERLCRYGARPPLSLERLRRLPGGRIAYRLKYVSRGRGKHRVMTAMEFMARLAAIIAPPRYPLVRYGGVLAPRSAWRRLVVPKPPERTGCDDACGRTTREANDCPSSARSGAERPAGERPRNVPERPTSSTTRSAPPDGPGATAVGSRPRTGDVVMLTPNVLSVQHWDRLLGGLLYAATPRVDWAPLLRRSFAVDVLQCPKCNGRLRVLAVITERESVRPILAHLGMPTDAPPIARARDPTDDQEHADEDSQLALGLA